jgi:hypothetical protein
MFNTYAEEQDPPKITASSPDNFLKIIAAKTSPELATNSLSSSLERQSPSLVERSASPSIKIPVLSPKPSVPLTVAFSFHELPRESILREHPDENGNHPMLSLPTCKSGTPFSTYMSLSVILSTPPKIPQVIMKQHLIEEIKGYFQSKADLKQDEEEDGATQIMNADNQELMFTLDGADDKEPNPVRP